MSTTTIRYTLKTEHCASTLVAQYFDGFELVRGEGYWQGKQESSISIVILADETDHVAHRKVFQLAEAIRVQYKQAEVWITQERVLLHRVVGSDGIREGLS